MATAFPDTKPFPTAQAAGMRHNNPPLEDSILMEFDENLRGREGLIERIAEMETRAAATGPCTSDDQAGRCGDFIKATAAAVKAVEEEREVLNRPLLNAGRALKAKADSYAARAAAAGATVRVGLDKYLADKLAAEQAEAARLAEIARQEEAERQRVIDEANAKAEREAEAERQRLQAIEDARAEAERVRLQAIEDAKAEAEAREAAAVVVEAEKIEVAPEPVYVPPPQPAFQSQPFEKKPIRGDYGTSVSTTETWHVEVEHIRQVPDAYLKHPAVLEALAKVLGPLVRPKNGLRNIKGCRIWSTTGSSVR